MARTLSENTGFTRYEIQNFIVLLAQTAAWFLCLEGIQRSPSWIITAAILVFFCLLMQGLFSFMHECFHDRANRDERINWALGTWASILFGTSYTLFDVNHHGHHVRNRTRPELVDYVYPDESAAKKTFLYYVAILGGIWLGGLVGSLLLPLLPYSSVRWLSKDKRDNTYSTAFAEFRSSDWSRMRFESILMVSVWAAAICFRGWSWTTVGLAYAAFAFSWSSLQWVYHVRTPIHPVEGAYNLRLPVPVRLLFLNFNYNLTHHRKPTLPWQELYAKSNQEETQPLWYRYLGIFLPPQPMPRDVSSIRKTYF